MFSSPVQLKFLIWFYSIMHHIYWSKPWFSCRDPNPDAVVVVHTPAGVFSARSLLPNPQGCFRGSRLASLKNTELPESSTVEINEFEPLSAARCRAFIRSNNKVPYICLYNLLFIRILVASLIFFLYCKALISFLVKAEPNCCYCHFVISLLPTKYHQSSVFLVSFHFYFCLPEGRRAASIPPIDGAKTSFFRCNK